MKRHNLIILILTAAYSFLFYDQHAGLNFLIFSLITAGALIVLNPQALKNRLTVLVLALYLLSGTCVLIYSSALAILANVISLLLLSAYNCNSRSSVIFNVCFGLYSIISAPVFMIINMVKPDKKQDEGGVKKSKLRSLTYIVPLMFALVFFFLYKSANPLFEKYTEELNLDFISIAWLLFTLGGFFVAYGFIKHQRIIAIDNWENNIPVSITISGKTAGRWDERKAAVILFVLLNLMMMFINLLDLKYLYLGSGMPEGVTHKQFVHHGVGMLILSISLAVTLILYFFRGGLNFDARNKTIKWLVYAWIAQNLMMVISTAIRNNMYVSDALLTYKRIGVYYWLLMAAFGLLTTFIKIRNTRSGWYLLKVNSMIAYVVLVLSACVDWDAIIGKYNLSHSSLIASLDKKYLLSISEANIPELYKIKDRPGFEVDSAYHYMAGYYSEPNTELLDRKLYYYLAAMKNDNWKSFSCRKQHILNELTELNEKEKIRVLNFSGLYIRTLKPVSLVSNITELDISQCSLSALSELSGFKKLRKLNLDMNEVPSLDSLPGLKDLRYLSANDNDISEFEFIERYPFLEALQLNSNHIQDINGFPASATIKELALGGNPLIDLRPLNRFPNLEKLFLNGLSSAIENFPSLSSLKFLELKNSENAERTLNITGAIASLQYLDISSNTLRNISPLLQNDASGFSAKFPKLEDLILYSNHLDNVYHIGLFTELKRLDLGHNKIKYADELSQLKMLSQLDINANLLGNVNFLDGLQQLVQLNLSDNARVLDFAPLKGLKNLKELNLSETRFNDLSLISSYGLTTLNMSGCRFDSLAELEKQKNLRILFVSYLKQTDISYLKHLKTLKELHVSKTDNKLIVQLKKALPDVKLIAN